MAEIRGPQERYRNGGWRIDPEDSLLAMTTIGWMDIYIYKIHVWYMWVLVCIISIWHKKNSHWAFGLKLVKTFELDGVSFFVFYGILGKFDTQRLQSKLEVKINWNSTVSRMGIPCSSRIIRVNKILWITGSIFRSPLPSHSCIPKFQDLIDEGPLALMLPVFWSPFSHSPDS